LLAEGKIKPHPAIVRERGLAGIPDGWVAVADPNRSILIRH
jgi:hypothetical protein